MDIQSSTNVSGCGQRVPKVLARPRQHRGTNNNNEVRLQRLRDDSLPLLWMSLLRVHDRPTKHCLGLYASKQTLMPLACEPQTF